MRRERNTMETADRWFWPHVEKSDACWIWQGSKLPSGYGLVCVYRRLSQCAHRISYELTHGAIEPGMVIAHHCDVPSCVRPDHLFQATQKENIADAIRKGRRAEHRIKATAA